LLVSQRHGSIVAAPTFGLPEAIGAGRNWDYRYTWIRDASFTLYALSRLGFHSESKAFMQWLAARCRDLGPNEPLQIMYGTDGRRDLSEVELSHWERYRGSSPVRIGNGACQFQKYLRMWADRAEINANVAMLFANSFESEICLGAP
jgi:GH15 family glucan-1,4-alpha-glucosidase